MTKLIQVTKSVEQTLRKNIGIFPIKEDTFRYYFFEEMLKKKNGGRNIKTDIVLELPYDNTYKNYQLIINPAQTITGTPELDAFYYDGTEKIALEFKYLIKDGNKIIGKPNRLAQIYNDIFRLSVINVGGIRKFFVYVESDEMFNYEHAQRDGEYIKVFSREKYPYTTTINVSTIFGGYQHYPDTFSQLITNSNVHINRQSQINVKIHYSNNINANSWIYLVEVL